MNHGIIESILLAYSIILFSELGDKTFFMTSLMVPKVGALPTFIGSVAALTLMTIVAVVCGHVAGHLINQKAMQFISGCVFAYFGASTVVEMLQDKKVEDTEEVNTKETDLTSFISRVSIPFITIITLEIGDKSQFSSLALGSVSNMLGIIIGAIGAYISCSGLAVLAGRFIGNRINNVIIQGVLSVSLLAVATTHIVSSLS